MSKKTIRCISHGIIATNTFERSPWEDVWIEWKGKPGRKLYRAAPCLVCAAEHMADLAMHDQIRSEHEEPTWYLDHDEDIKQALRTAATEGYACMGTGGGLTITTLAKGITRKEAERMLTWYLRRTHGIKHVRFSWQRPKHTAQPVGFGNYLD